VGSRRDCTWILGLRGFRVVTMDEGESGRLLIRIERRSVRRYACSGCGRRTSRVRSSVDRTWDDLPWASRHVTLIYPQRRLVCRTCGIRADRIDRTDATATALFTEDLTGRQRGAIAAVCTDMWRPYLAGVASVLPKAEIVFDKFHVLQHASSALDEVRRQEFFRAGTVMREHGRGKRWLLLRHWNTVRGLKRAELHALFAANRRLFKAYVLREQLDRLWTYKTRPGAQFPLQQSPPRRDYSFDVGPPSLGR
jgi:transposase